MHIEKARAFLDAVTFERSADPEEASDAAASICNLGLDCWPDADGPPDTLLVDHDLVTVLSRAGQCCTGTSVCLPLIASSRCCRIFRVSTSTPVVNFTR
jgi:hypothetical protein